MKPCPRCETPLRALEHHGLRPQMCPVCRGVFFERRDLQRQLGPAMSVLRNARVIHDEERGLQCPANCGVPMHQVEVNGPPKVQVDCCPLCDGVWFDADEVSAVLEAGRAASAAAGAPVRWRPGMASSSGDAGSSASAANTGGPPSRAGSQRPAQVFAGAPSSSLARAATSSPAAIRSSSAIAVAAAAGVMTAELRAQRELDAIATEASSVGSAKSAPHWFLFSFITGLPLEGFNPLYRFPIVTWSILAACVAVFGVELSQPNLSAFVAAHALIPDQFGEPGTAGRVLAAMFMHANLVHLLGNLYFLKVFGDNVEDRLGRGWFIAFYLGCGVLADLAYIALNGASSVPMLGASGAIAGLLGGYLVFFPHARVSVVFLFRQWHLRAIWYLPFWLGWQFFSAAVGVSGVAWWAHIGGFGAGVLLGIVAQGMLRDARIGVILERNGSGVASA